MMRRTILWLFTLKFLLFVLCVAFALRIYRLATPPTYYFDEVYHAVTAKLYARNDPSGYEWWHPAPEPDTAIEWLHPPIAKLFQAGGILVFGENAFGWRISSVLFGLGVIAATYVLAFRLTKVRRIAELAALFASIDGLLFAQSRIAMNDIHVVFFMLLAFIFYVRMKTEKPRTVSRNLLFSGICAGLAVSTKWSGMFVLLAFGADQALSSIKAWKLPPLRMLLKMVVAWIFIPTLLYVLSYGQFWLQGHSVDQFVELHKQIWYYQTHLTATHTYQSTPLQWVFDLRPVWYSVQYVDEHAVGNIYNAGNPVIFIGGLLCLLYIFARCIHKFAWWKWFLFSSYGSVWMLWVFSPRIMFFYHYAPAVPLLCIALGWGTWVLWKSPHIVLRITSVCVVCAAIAWFAVFYPYISGLPVSTEFANAVYFAFQGWK